MFPNSQHFEGRKACQSSKMGLGKTHKQKFKMKSTYKTKKGRQLMQVEWKWCNKFSKDNFKHKLYTTWNLWEEALLPSLQYTLCLFVGTTPKCHFSLGLLNGSTKIRTLVIPKLWTFISLLNQSILKMQGKYLITLKKIFSTVYNIPN